MMTKEMVRREFIQGYEEFIKSLKVLSEEIPEYKLYIYFIGEKNHDGKSWCPDCNEAETTVNKAIESYADDKSIFLTVDVGDKSFWKDETNPFRRDKDLKLFVIPTVIQWKTVLRLEGEQCANLDLLEMFFKE